MTTPIAIVEFEPAWRQQVIDLIVGIQRNEFDIDITAGEQPDLADIPGFYQAGKGNFWVAHDGPTAVGTISLKDIGGDAVALRKMFVAQAFRGSEHGVAASLLRTALAHAKERGVWSVYLGTTAAFLAAHRFYEKHGFREVGRSELPESFPVMRQDSRFYRLDLS